MHLNCAQCSSSYEVTAEDLEFYDKISPIIQGVKYPVPAPKQCPRCRQQRRLAWRNDMNLFRRDCDLCKKSMVSVHPAKADFPVYCVQCWWSDRWNPFDFARDYDQTKPFLKQFLDLQKQVPQIAIQNDNGVGSENSEYCYDISRAKNCYRVVGSWYIEECAYSLNVNRSKFVVDCNTVSINSELVYESLDSQHLYHCAYLQNCEACNECFFGYDLKSCSNCFACYGLRQKKFHIFNQPYTEAEYRQKLSSYNLGSYEAIEKWRKEFDLFANKKPRRAANIQNSEDCIGNNLFNCKSVLGYSVFNSEYSKFIDRSDGPKNCYDIINSGGCQWSCDCVTPDDSYLVLFSDWCWKSKNILYSDNCHSSADLCGCISMRRNQFCILNKQYKEADYHKLLPKIINSLTAEGVWGEHLAVKHSPFCYNVSSANEYYPLEHDVVLAQGWKWEDELPYTFGKESIKLAEIPDDIMMINDSICNEVLACIDCKRNYKITPQEFSFYKKIPAPLPRSCPNCRHLKRFQRKTKTAICNRQCDRCAQEIKTVYPKEGSEIVYCDNCYFAEVY